MRRYWWPGYEMQLLGALQRQQNSAQFCDTLLQTEGISVPTHSCVLAALSPYLSQELSASPPPASGQKLQLQLRAVKAQTLLKLVGLLYSGELEVKGSVEQDDVLAAARQFGIADLVEGRRARGMKRQGLGSCRQSGFHAEESRAGKMQDAQVQAEMAASRDTGFSVAKRSRVSTGTQTVKETVKHATLPTPESAPRVSQGLDFPVFFPQSIPLEKQFCSTSCPVIPSMLSGAPSEGESLNRPFGGVVNPTPAPALSSDVLTLGADSGSSRPQEDSAHQQSPEFVDRIRILAEERTKLETCNRHGEASGKRGDTEQPSQDNGDEMPGDKRAKATGKRHVCANVGMKNLAKMKQMQQVMETAQISIKVKLRRRTRGEVWEVVSMQGTDQTVSVLTSRKQDGSDHKRPETDLSIVPPPPSTVQPRPAQKQYDHRGASSDSQPPSSDCFSPNQNGGLEAAPLVQHQGSVEESDEQIEKLLEDIMMGLNILPDLGRDCSGPHRLQPSPDGVAALSRVPVAQHDPGHGQMRAAVSAAGCAFYHDLETQSYSSTADTGCFTTHSQPGGSGLSSVPPDAELMQQQQESPPQYQSSVTSLWQRDGMSHGSMPLSKGQERPHPEAPATRSPVPSAFFPAGQKLHYPEFQEPSSHDSQHILEFLPLTIGSEAQSVDALSLPCLDDLRLPQCLSPLEACTTATKHQPAVNDPTHLADQIQQQLCPHVPPWLTENPEFPLSFITYRKNESASLPQDTNRRQELNPQNGGTWAGYCSVKELAERETGQQNAAELKSEPRKMNEGDATGSATARKRRKTKHTSPPQDGADCFLTYKDVKVSDGTKSQILNVCQVRLSSNNVLAKEREMAKTTLNLPSRFVGKPNEPSSVTESQKTRGSGVNADHTRIKTRGFLKRTQDSLSDASAENSSVAKTVGFRARRVNRQGVTSWKRGRQTKLEALTPPMTCSPERRCKKRLNTSTEAGVNPSKNTISVESVGQPDVSDSVPQVRECETPKWPQTVILKEFQKLIKRKHSEMRRSKESQETGETVRGPESEGMASRDGTCQESTREADLDVDVTRPQDGCGSEESQAILSVTLDKNHNQILTASVDEFNESQQETGLFGGKDHPAFSFDVLEEEVTKLAGERQQPPKNPDEETTRDTGVSDSMQQTAIADEGLSHRDAHLPQENKLPPHHKLRPETPERTGPPLSDAGGTCRTPGCDGEEEEEEEEVEVEVDVLCYSPVRVPETREPEDGLSNTEITPDDEEEEDVNEIDVTGDEAE